MKWTFWKVWRYWLTLSLGLALFVLAGLQATGTDHSVSTRSLAIGVATKVITGVLAIMVIRIVQDVMDRVDRMSRRLNQLQDRLDRLGLPEGEQSDDTTS